MKRKWIRCGDTQILMELNTDNLVPEWHIVGYVLKRQVYESFPAGWYAFKSDNRMILAGPPGSPFKLGFAKQAVELAATVRAA